MGVPEVSVIVPVFNDADGLRRCLDALARQAFPAAARETIVVDNGSTDDLSPVRREHPEVVWLHEEKPGSYAARNRGLQVARGPYLAFIDADCVARPDWLGRGLARLRADPALGFVGGRVQVTARDPQRPTWTETFELHTAFPQEKYILQDAFSGTGNLFTRRDVFDAVGPFRADLRSGGDREWGNRVVAAGYHRAYAEDAVVEHPARHTIRELAAKTRRVTGGHRDLGLAPEMASIGKHVKTTVWAAFFPYFSLGNHLRTYRYLGRRTALRIHAVSWVLALVRVLELWRLRLGSRSRR